MKDIELIADQIAQDLELQALLNELPEPEPIEPEIKEPQDEIDLYF